MCRSIKKLNNKDQIATNDEIYEAARQYVRKVSGIRNPSEKNKKAFEKAIAEITKATTLLLSSCHESPK